MRLRPVVPALAAVLIAVVGCTAGDTAASTTLKFAGTGSAGGALDHVPERLPYIVYVSNLCIIGPAATITDIATARPQGAFDIVDWGVANLSAPVSGTGGAIGAAPGVLSKDATSFTHRPVTTKCATKQNFQLDINVQRNSAAVAESHGFWVHYKDADGRTGKVLAPFIVFLCPTDCPHLDVSQVG
jgi:hypothetical protein